jgi:diguanylate cyclase (GGDEF)-like protein
MSFIGQIWLKLCIVVAVAFIGGVAVHADATRDTLQRQLRLHNVADATALGKTLSEQSGDVGSIEQTLSAQFDAGSYRRIRFVAGEGGSGWAREALPQSVEAPSWLSRLLPIVATPGVTQVSAGGRLLGRLEGEGHDAPAYEELWQSLQRAAAAMAVVALVAALAGALIVGRLRRPLEQALAQARSLERGEYATAPEPATPELRRLVRAMNVMAVRLKQSFEGQAQQVEMLRRRAHCDGLTGLSNRAHFMRQLDASLQREDGSADGGLVLWRVVDLAELNRTAGHDGADRMLGAIAQALQAYTARVEGCFVGRLNGPDFAMSLPAAGVAEETARAVNAALQVALPAFGPQAAVIAGAVEIRRGMALADVLAQADVALARAEAHGRFAVATAGEPSPSLARLGEGGWRRRIHEAMAAGRVALAEYPVRGRAGQLLHLECPLRVQIEPDGPQEPAACWLPLALRGRLTAALDERALSLVLGAITLDGQPRAVNLATASLADSGFAARLRAQLLQAPRAARQVWLELPEAAAADHFQLVRELGRQLHPAGVRLGLEHAGERLGRIERFVELGLDYVKLDAAVTREVGRDAQRASFVTGLVAMLHSFSVQVVAEGVAEEADALALWDCGVDAQTGPWVSQREGTAA